MKLIKLLPLWALLTLGCYETTAMPESLTADNFYIGTFTFTDFEDKSIPDFTFTFTKDRFTITDSNGITYVDTKNVMNVRDDMGLIEAEFTNPKNFSFGGTKLVYYSLEPVEDARFDAGVNLQATDKGFSVSMRILEYKKGSEAGEILQTNRVCFSNYDLNFIKEATAPSGAPEFNEKIIASSNTFIWNGKKYKSVSK